jgi:hypothetical protein
MSLQLKFNKLKYSFSLKFYAKNVIKYYILVN